MGCSPRLRKGELARPCQASLVWHKLDGRIAREYNHIIFQYSICFSNLVGGIDGLDISIWFVMTDSASLSTTTS
jgi:hypothetical protein